MPFLVAATEICVAQATLQMRKRIQSQYEMAGQPENGSRGSPQLLTVHLGQAHIYSARRPT